MICFNNWYVPFEDFFSNLPNNEKIENFGKEARTQALKFCSQRRSVVDIGAHIGISVRHWATEFENIYAFEPSKDHFNCLLKNTEDLKNLKSFNFALSNYNGSNKATYRSLKNSGSFQLIDANYIQPKNKKKIRKLIDVDVKKLDSFIFDSIDLIKIDVEGWEYEVIEGAVETLKKHRPVLMIETLVDHPNKTLKSDYDFNKLNNLLSILEYREVAHISPDDKVFVPNE
jgi:FkbM family methyltransferase